MKLWIKPEIEVLEVTKTEAVCNIDGKTNGSGDEFSTLDCNPPIS